ncbi:hypothetical protein [Endozoicomonas atrinae]|uniref:hypothetical protein n=1 Tax=Endozoicomonas atrinae TaxID=1333660 RepID=UPI0008248964|nr:hypothetical protein [Endozoicomonas atrinae]
MLAKNDPYGISVITRTGIPQWQYGVTDFNAFMLALIQKTAPSWQYKLLQVCTHVAEAFPQWEPESLG